VPFLKLLDVAPTLLVNSYEMNMIGRISQLTLPGAGL
jgi:hypothetical protein